MYIIGYKLTRKTISLGFGQSLREFKAYFYINGHLDCVMANLRCQLDIFGKREPQLKKNVSPILALLAHLWDIFLIVN